MADEEIPQVHFGTVNVLPLDWRSLPEDETLDDDSELPQTSPEVIGILGFDPKE